MRLCLPALLTAVRSLFCCEPLFFFDAWIGVVMPSLSALLSDAAGEVRSDQTPFRRTMLTHQLYNALILLSRPRTDARKQTGAKQRQQRSGTAKNMTQRSEG